MDMLADLNPQQRQAVESGSLPTLIMAGPGTGKTKTLAARIAYLLDGRANPQDILALTFTAKAAQEMCERVRALVGDATLPKISTFHALGYDIISSHQGKQLEFVTDQSRLELIRSLPRSAALKDTTVRELSLLVSRVKGAEQAAWPDDVSTFVGRYDQALHRLGLVDFDDLLRQSRHLLQDNPDLQARYRHVLVDEFQDTSELQWSLVQMVRASDSVFAIGDPRQSIYGFRGAGGDMFARFHRDFPAAQQITLTTNYRSAGAIVRLANSVFPKEAGLDAFSTQPGSAQAIETLNEYSEADLVLQLIEQGIGGSDLLRAGESEGRRFSDFAVLYRTHRTSKSLQRRLHDSGIPFQVVGEGSPYDHPDVQAVVGGLRWLVTGQELPAVKGLSPAQVSALLQPLERNQPVSVLARSIARAFGYSNDQAANARLGQLVSTLVRFDDHPNGLADCVAYLDTISQGEFYDPQADAVTLMTIHASKGLEFAHVILIAAEEGILPHQRKTAPTDYDEEQRLFYVAVTRAKDKLDITYAKKRANQAANQSRFIQELAQDVLPRTADPQTVQLEKKIKRRRQKARQATLF